MTQGSDSAGWADVDRAAEAFTRMLAARTGQFEAVEHLLVAMLDLEPGHNVIDVGCGNGDHALVLAQAVSPSGRVVGVDRSEAMIAAAQERSAGAALPVTFQPGDAENLAFPEASFDRARASLLLLHVEDPAVVLAEMARVTQPGGLVLVAENDLGASTITGTDRELTRRVLDFVCDNFRHGWIGRQLPGLFLDAGLADLNVRPFTIVLRDLALWERINGEMRPMLEQAIDRGILSPGDIDRWLADVRTIDAAGHFLASFTAFAVSGRKP